MTQFSPITKIVQGLTPIPDSPTLFFQFLSLSSLFDNRISKLSSLNALTSPPQPHNFSLSPLLPTLKSRFPPPPLSHQFSHHNPLTVSASQFFWSLSAVLLLASRSHHDCFACKSLNLMFWIFPKGDKFISFIHYNYYYYWIIIVLFFAQIDVVFVYISSNFGV